MRPQADLRESPGGSPVEEGAQPVEHGDARPGRLLAPVASASTVRRRDPVAARPGLDAPPRVSLLSRSSDEVANSFQNFGRSCGHPGVRPCGWVVGDGFRWRRSVGSDRSSQPEPSRRAGRTTDVHAIAAKGPRVLSGAAATPNEFGAWISEGKHEAAGSGSTSLPSRQSEGTLLDLSGRISIGPLWFGEASVSQPGHSLGHSPFRLRRPTTSRIVEELTMGPALRCGRAFVQLRKPNRFVALSDFLRNCFSHHHPPNGSRRAGSRPTPGPATWRPTRATKRSPGSSRSSSADSRAKVAWGSKLGTARSTPTTISLTPRMAL
jgi:hypothetical protein